jgi:hypothetical protein
VFSDHYSCFVVSGDFIVDFDKHKIHYILLLDVCNDNDFRFAILFTMFVPSISHMILI